MISCATFREQIELRADDALDAQVEAQLERHLSQCSACLHYDAAQRTLSGDLTTLSRIAHSLAAIESSKPPRRLHWLHAGRIAAAVAFAILCTWTFVRRPEPKPVIDSTPVKNESIVADASPSVRFAVSLDPAEQGRRFTIPVETENPQIHMVWLYDAASPETDAAPSSAPSS